MEALKGFGVHGSSLKVRVALADLEAQLQS